MHPYKPAKTYGNLMKLKQLKDKKKSTKEKYTPKKSDKSKIKLIDKLKDEDLPPEDERAATPAPILGGY